VALTPWETPTKPWAECSAERQAKLRLAWGSGNLTYKLDPSQREIYADIFRSHTTVKSSLERVYVLDIARQSGKDFLMSVIALEQIYRVRKSRRIPYAAPTRDNVHELLIPTFEGIFEDCPPELRPSEIQRNTFRTNSPELTWPWGGRIVLVGVDLHPDWLRGPATHCCLFTEPAFVDQLDEVLEGVLLPQLLTKQDGFTVMGSTPPTTPGHSWSTKWVPRAKAQGMYSMRTIEQCPRLDDEQIRGAIRQYGGRDSVRCRRELFCEHIVDSSAAVVPEWAEAKATIVTEEGFSTPPTYRDTYVSLDPGFAHGSGAIFGYYDFAAGLMMIEGDFWVQGLNSREVAERVKAREWQLWGRPPVRDSRHTEAAAMEQVDRIRSHFYSGLPTARQPVLSWRDKSRKDTTFKRVSDTASILIADLSREHGLVFSPTEKDDTDAATNAMRLKIQNKAYRIHPRCTNLITHLEQATWNRSRTRLAESPGGGHFDCLKALEYLTRNVIWGKNPNPPVQFDPHNYHIPNRDSDTKIALNQALGGSSRRRGRKRGG